jgi:phospholipase C
MGVQVAGLGSIDHVVLVMLENRSFDHMLGFLYPKSGNFDGLDGTESNLAADGSEVRVFPITPGIQNAYYFPLANPAEGYKATNDQLFSSDTPPASMPWALDVWPVVRSSRFDYCG